MVVYIEYVVMDNIIINYILLWLTCKISNKSTARRNILFSAMLGAIFVVFMPLISDIQIVLILYRLVVGAIMTLIVVGIGGVRRFIAYYIVFVVLTLLFGGMLIAILSIFDIIYTTSGLIFLNFEVPLSIFVLPIYLFAILVWKVFKYISGCVHKYGLYYDVVVVIGDNRHKYRAYLDTGNDLVDINGTPCMVIDLKTFCNIFEKIT